MSANQPDGMKRYLPLFIIAAVLLAAVGGGMMLFKKNGEPEPTGGAAVNNNQTGQTGATPTPTPRLMLADLPAGGQPPHVRGHDDAPVTLEEFGDFECPPCGRLYPELKKIEDLYGAQLRVVFREFPLDTLHPHAVAAARAAEAAGRQNRFWEMHDMLYEQQDVWKNDADVESRFMSYARTIGLNVEQFRSDMDAPAVIERIIADRKRGNSNGVTGTPTVFVNGREVPAASQTFDGLRSIIDSAMAGKKQ